MPQADTLDRIPRGARVRVICVDSAVSKSNDTPEAQEARAQADAIARRLDDLGIRKGVALEVIRRAPLGDPTVFELHGYQLCLRKSESSRVRVEPEATEANLK
jgi:ferrous iron transport protein A